MISAVKAALRRSPIYPYYFARKTAPQVQLWTQADQDRLRFFRQFVKPGDLVFDVGANVGHFTKVFLKAGCRVVAIEPLPICAQTLRRAFGRKVQVVEAALSRSPGRAVLHSIDGVSVLSSLEPDYIRCTQQSGRFANFRWQHRTVVKLKTLDQIIEAYGKPSLIKIDAEGHDLGVLEGLSIPIQFLTFEFVPENFERSLKCVDRIASLGRYEFNFSFMDGNELTPDWRAPEDMKSLLTAQARQNAGLGDVYARLMD